MHIGLGLAIIALAMFTLAYGSEIVELFRNNKKS